MILNYFQSLSERILGELCQGVTKSRCDFSIFIVHVCRVQSMLVCQNHFFYWNKWQWQPILVLLLLLLLLGRWGWGLHPVVLWLNFGLVFRVLYGLLGNKSGLLQASQYLTHCTILPLPLPKVPSLHPDGYFSAILVMLLTYSYIQEPL